MKRFEELTSAAVVSRRLHTQRLTGPKFQNPAEAVAFFGAVQAQDFLPAMWALGLRTNGATEAIVEQAVNDRQIVRTWPFRGTIHFVSPADIRWMLQLSAPRVLKDSARLRELELDAATFARSRKVLSNALKDGRPQTRATLYGTLDEAGISPAGQRGYHILFRHAMEGLICIGPREGKRPTFVLLDEWVPISRKLARDEALAELALRYFTSHSPANLQDFTWWSGLTATEARSGLEAIGDKLSREELGGHEYWFGPEGGATAIDSPICHLLPVYDEYFVAYKDRSAALAPKFAARKDSGNGIFRPPIVIDGQIAGTWTRKLKKASVTVAANLFRPLEQGESDALHSAAERYGSFLGRQGEIAPAS